MTSGAATVPPLSGPGVRPRNERIWRRIWVRLAAASPQALLSHERVDPQVVGRLGGLFFAVGALGALAAMPFRPLTEDQRSGIVVVCATALVVAALA